MREIYNGISEESLTVFNCAFSTLSAIGAKSTIELVRDIDVARIFDWGAQTTNNMP